MNLPSNFDRPFINNGRICDRCGATFKKLTFKCKFCGRVLINEDYLRK